MATANFNCTYTETAVTSSQLRLVAAAAVAAAAVAIVTTSDYTAVVTAGT